MDNSMEYEDFLPTVRKTLYGRNYSEPKPSENTHRKTKKVKFTTDSSFDTEFQVEHLKNKREPTPYKRKVKKLMQNGNDFGSQETQKSKKEYSSFKKKKTPKRKQVVISFSSSSESFDEEVEDFLLTPSKSELDSFNNTFGNSPEKQSSRNISDLTTEDEASVENFDLNSYFSTREISELNESITEAHSGIDYEFVSDYVKDVKVVSSEPINQFFKLNSEEKINNSSDSDEDFIEDVTSASDEQNIQSVTEKIQDSMIISDDEYKEISFDDTQLTQELLTEFDKPEYYDFGDRKVVILKESQSLPFHGLFTLKVLYGKLEVLGSILDTNSAPVDIYSSRGSALLYIKNITPSSESEVRENDEYIEISRLVPIETGLENVNNIFIKPNCAAFLCIKLDNLKVQFVEKYISQRIFPRLEKSNVPQVIFEPTDGLNVLKQSAVWEEILNNVTVNSKLMIAGGKGVGKSTLLRFAINKLLNKFEKIIVLDLDPGQSEFAVPGCVSIVTVVEPVFGPNFTHLKQTERSLLSNINVGYDPKAYINCVKSLASSLELSGEYPILINCMGFVQGIGLQITASSIKYIRPTNVIQICSKSQNKNFRVDLTIKTIEENCKLFCDDDKIHLNYSELDYKLHKVPAMNDENSGWTLEARKSREMCVLAYFGQMMSEGVNSLTSHEVSMYEIKLSAIKITNLQGEEIAPAVVNANMVALCSLDQHTNIFICLGYGVVRGIDLDSDLLVLVTPEPPSILEEVHYLVLGSVSLPPSVYMTPDDLQGAIPYVMEGELVSLGQITKRSYLPANKK